MIRGEKLTFRAGGRALVDDVTVEVEAGKFVAILGPNGAGKSTLLKMLCGQLRPHDGTITFDGKPLSDWNPMELARQRAVLPQSTTVPFNFTAYEIVLLGRSPHGDASKCRDMAMEAMKWTECDHLADRIVNTLSGGEMQRVNLARVLLQIGLEPGTFRRLLILDEPISSLDPAHQHGALRVARRVAHEGAGVLVVLHDLNLAAQYADHIILMQSGKIVAQGTPEDVFQPQLVRDVFSIDVAIVRHPQTGTPAMLVTP